MVMSPNSPSPPGGTPHLIPQASASNSSSTKIGRPSINPPPSPSVYSNLSPRSLMAKGLGLVSGRGGGGGGVGSLLSPSTPLQTSTTSSSSSSSIRLDEKAQRMLEDLIHQAHSQQQPSAASSSTSFSDSGYLPTPRSTNASTSNSIIEETSSSSSGLPSVMRLEDLASQHELGLAGLTPTTATTTATTNGGKGGGGRNGGGRKDEEGGGKAFLLDPVHIRHANKRISGLSPLHSPSNNDREAGSLRLKGSPPLHIHRDKVSCVRLTERGQSVCSTSDDGSFRVSSVVIDRDTAAAEGEGGEEDLLHIGLRSKRHFTPSEIALSCCALVEDETKPMAILGSWDNSIYIYSVSSARQILKLDGHDDGISSLDVRGNYLCTGSWDATVKIWSLLPSGIDPHPLVEFFDQAKQVQSVSLGEGELVAAGSEDGIVMIWDMRARAVVASFEGSSHHEPVTCVRWGGSGGKGQQGKLYVISLDGSLRCYTADGRLLSNVQTNVELRCLEVRPWGRREGGVGYEQVHEGGAGGSGATTEVLILGCGDGSLRFWSCTSLIDEGGVIMKEVLQVPQAHKEAITCLDVNWSRGRVVTGSQDATLRLWDMEVI